MEKAVTRDKKEYVQKLLNLLADDQSLSFTFQKEMLDLKKAYRIRRIVAEKLPKKKLTSLTKAVNDVWSNSYGLDQEKEIDALCSPLLELLRCMQKKRGDSRKSGYRQFGLVSCAKQNRKGIDV